MQSGKGVGAVAQAIFIQFPHSLTLRENFCTARARMSVEPREPPFVRASSQESMVLSLLSREWCRSEVRLIYYLLHHVWGGGGGGLCLLRWGYS